MGSGLWREDTFRQYSSRVGRVVDRSGRVAGNYSNQEMFAARNLDPMLNPKDVMRECCDTEEHPNTIPVILALDVTDKPAGVCNFLHKTGQRVRVKNVARRDVFNRAGGRVDFQNVIGRNFLNVVANFKERQTDVDSVAIKNSRETRRDDNGNSRRLDCNRSMFTTGAATEIFSADHDVACFDVRRKSLVDVNHAVLSQFSGIKRVQIARGNYNVGVDVVAVTPNFAFNLHLEHLFRSRNFTENSTCRRNERTCQINFAVDVSHASAEISVGRRNATFARAQNAHITA